MAKLTAEIVIAKVPCPICGAAKGTACTKAIHDLAAGNVHHVRIYRAENRVRTIRRR